MIQRITIAHKLNQCCKVKHFILACELDRNQDPAYCLYLCATLKLYDSNKYGVQVFGCRKKMSAIAILEYSGAEQLFKTMSQQAQAGREEWHAHHILVTYFSCFGSIQLAKTLIDQRLFEMFPLPYLKSRNAVRQKCHLLVPQALLFCLALIFCDARLLWRAQQLFSSFESSLQILTGTRRQGSPRAGCWPARFRSSRPLTGIGRPSSAFQFWGVQIRAGLVTLSFYLPQWPMSLYLARDYDQHLRSSLCVLWRFWTHGLHCRMYVEGNNVL